MSLISLHRNKILILALVYWTLEIVARIFMHYQWEYFQIVKNDAYNEYIFVVLDCIGNLFSGFLVLYIHQSLKKENNLNIENIDENGIDLNLNNIQLIEGKKSSYYRSKNFRIKFIFMVLLYVLCSLSFFIFYQLNKDANHYNVSHKVQKDIINQIDILARYFLSIYCLRGHVFKHYKFSIILITISIFILMFNDYFSINNDPKIDVKLTWIYIAIFSARAILFPVSDTLAKKIFDNDYLIPEKLMFFRGCGEFIILIIITPILFFSLNVKNDFLFNPYNVNLSPVFIGYTLCSFIKGIILLKVIYYFSSQSVSFLIISESITGSIYSIYDYFNSGKKLEIILSFIEIIAILITTFATLVFDEIIIIHKCDLDRDAKREIIKRGKNEIQYIFTIKKQYINNKDYEKDEEKNEENNLEKEEENALALRKLSIYE